MNLAISNVWMVHESGTKFYQIFSLRNGSKKTITVTHFGKLKDATSRRPVVIGGQVVIAESDIYDTKLREKSARGYQSKTSKDYEFVPVPVEWLVEQFGASRASELHKILYGTVLGEYPQPTDDADNEILAGKAEAEPEARPEHWGSW